MEINVRFLENRRLEAQFDDFKVVTDQPIRYKGDGSAPSPFDYFLASSALCAAYFVKVYCLARDIPTADIKLSQNNIIDPENRYRQTFQIKAQLPASLSAKHRAGILQAIERCTVKKVVQEGPQFEIAAVDVLGAEAGLIYNQEANNSRTMILGKDAPLEETIARMTQLLQDIGIKIEIASWRNLVPHVWSVHIRDATSPVCFTNGKGATKESALCSALGEYLERLSCNYFYNDYYLGDACRQAPFVHYPNERWFAIPSDASIPAGLMDDYLLAIYDTDGELNAHHLVDTNSGLSERGICAVPFVRQSDQETIYIPVGLIGNLFVSNGMSAGNTLFEARVQCLSEIFERAVKTTIIREELSLPDVPADVIADYPTIAAGIKALEDRGYPVLVKDASLGGRYPVMCVTLLNPRNAGVYASFGAHPKWQVALERSLTELLQGRSFEGLDDVLPPTFNSQAVSEPNNIVEHFVDSTGVISWRFFSDKSPYQYTPWNIAGDTEAEHNYLMNLLAELDKEVYIADYDDLGAPACRILVPGYSEIYPIDDLVWDNNNIALAFRSDILNIHSLNDTQLGDLLERLEDSQMDHFAKIPDLIGVEFDENTVWGRLTIGELKLLILLALERYPEAQPLVAEFLIYNDNLHERCLFMRALDAVLAITVEPDLELADFSCNLVKMFGQEIMTTAIAAVTGRERFPGLTETDTNLKGLDRHLRMIASYHKLQAARSARN